ncbi:MarR family winged helix-turn-helix transcriptional regulator [Neobacillus sp. DY30]|uniref:MarR family winged helix-turn-helix transcriptional regulator n=1 Tax=Neobacillus sp. DY30 TaxID=3047871 RepID=UPI0024C07713|nr:MarR family winged helix-turn-helix transcriptional regulator [Neobacillus sp. DY30]WHY01033.1 MarR family winged helix-turn-helix transcriptional regulator [Neobacillus sp. DY30]
MNKDLEIICSKIVEYSNALSSLFLEDYKKLINDEFADLSTKQQVILELLRVKTRTVNEIAHFLSITASAASQLISKLEKQEYVKREINPVNRREIIVHLGEKGLHYNQMVAKNQLFIIEKYYAKLPKDDLEKLLDIHEKLYQIAVEAQMK